MPPPDPALIARFRADLEAITGRAPEAGSRLAVAVSGGADSLGLLLLAAAAYPGAVVAATIDHQLRAESAAEAAEVHAICETLGVPHDILRSSDRIKPQGNLQEEARGMRYTLLSLWAGSADFAGTRPWRAEWVATAHQQDDVAEGFLMRARRGAGVGGLAEMARARPLLDPRPGPPLIRPLLGWRRAKIAGVVAAAGIAPIEDPSNRHPRFDRSRIRGLLASTDELPTDRLAMAARNLRHAEEALTWATEREWAMRSRVDRESVGIDPSGLPYELRRRLALHAIRQVRAEFGLEGLWRETGIDRLVDLLDSGSAGTLAGVMARTKGSLWIFTPAPPRRSH